MKTSTIINKVIAMVAMSLGIPDKEKDKKIKLASKFEDLGADDIDLVEIIMMAEKEFNITIADSAVFKLKTVGKLVVYIENKLNKNGR